MIQNSSTPPTTTVTDVPVGKAFRLKVNNTDYLQTSAGAVYLNDVGGLAGQIDPGVTAGQEVIPAPLAQYTMWPTP